MNCCRNCHWWDRDDDTVEDACLFGPLMIKIPYSLLEENDCINYMDNSEMQLKNRIKELEIQLDKYVGMCANCPDLGNGYFALKDLEAQCAAFEAQLAAKEQELAEADDKARLQRALDRIEQAGCDVVSDIHHVTVYIPGYYFAKQMRFDGATRAEAAEAAAQWVESQKEGKHE